MTKEKISSVLQTNEGVLRVWTMFNNKYRKTKLNFVLINSTIFILTAALVLINLWAMLTLKNPPYDGSGWQWARNCFLAMAIITAFTGLLTAVLAIFKFKTRTRHAKDAIRTINAEFKEYKSKDGKYSEIENKEQMFIEFVSDTAFVEY